MNSKKFFFVLISGLGIMIIIFGAGAYQATKILQSEGSKLVDLKLADKVLDKQQEGLLKAKRDIEKFSELEAIAKSIVPQSKDQASTIAEISNMANQAGINLSSIKFPQSNLGSATKKGSKQSSDPAKSQLTELPDLKGVYIMDIEVSNNTRSPITYDQIIKFLQLLESSRRTAQVTNINITPEASGYFQLSININTYVRPE